MKSQALPRGLGNRRIFLSVPLRSWVVPILYSLPSYTLLKALLKKQLAFGLGREEEWCLSTL